MDIPVSYLVIATIYGLCIGIVHTIANAIIDDTINEKLPTLETAKDIRMVIRAGRVMLVLLTVFSPLVIPYVLITFRAKKNR